MADERCKTCGQQQFMEYFWDGFQFGTMFGIMLSLTAAMIFHHFVLNPILHDMNERLHPTRIKQIPGQWKVIPKEEKHIA